MVAHVDDGVWVGAGATYETAMARLRCLINIKTEASGEFEVLSRHVIKTAHEIFVDQFDYLSGLKPVYAQKI